MVAIMSFGRMPQKVLSAERDSEPLELNTALRESARAGAEAVKVHSYRYYTAPMVKGLSTASRANYLTARATHAPRISGI